MNYRVQIAPSAQRQLRQLPGEAIARLELAILALGDDSRPDGVRKLRGDRYAYRIRVGQYRVMYDIQDAEQLVVVTKVSRRNEATYR